jgi:hypothetical protein
MRSRLAATLAVLGAFSIVCRVQQHYKANVCPSTVRQIVAAARTSARVDASPRVTCRLRAYVPSEWEDSWISNVDDIAARSAVCPTIRLSTDLVDEWLTGIKTCAGTGCDKRVFSKFVRECKSTMDEAKVGRGNNVQVIEEYIEPLVGHMRHPHGLAACTPSTAKAVSVQDRSYLMLLGDDTASVLARHSGRAILLDAGTNRYRTSLAYFVSAYAARGIHFDAIYAWEAKPMAAAEYWASVPNDIKPRLHFYNAPVTPEPGSAMNPVEWIKHLHRPGDFIVFKLDVDNDGVESALAQQVLQMEDAGELIAEMFFEKHYGDADMKPYFGMPKTTYPEAIKFMHELRMKGVRVHYWP